MFGGIKHIIQSAIETIFYKIREILHINAHKTNTFEYCICIEFKLIPPLWVVLIIVNSLLIMNVMNVLLFILVLRALLSD